MPLVEGIRGLSQEDWPISRSSSVKLLLSKLLARHFGESQAAALREINRIGRSEAREIDRQFRLAGGNILSGLTDANLVRSSALMGNMEQLRRAQADARISLAERMASLRAGVHMNVGPLYGAITGLGQTFMDKPKETNPAAGILGTIGGAALGTAASGGFEGFGLGRLFGIPSKITEFPRF
jgi:hypothetical protein